MRILHIISNMKPESGGPQEAVRMMLRSAPADTQSEVITLDDPKIAAQWHEPFILHTPGGRSALRRWLRANRHRFDGVVLHGLWETLALAVLRTIAGRVPYVVYPHGMLDPYFKRAFPLKHAKKWLYWLPVQYWALRRAHRVVFTTAAERDLAAQSFWLHRWRPVIIGLGAEQPPCDLEHCKNVFLVHHPTLRGNRALLFLGRIDAKKGCDLLIDAFARVAALHDDLHLVMAGPDSAGWRSTLEAQVRQVELSHRVHWTGMLKDDMKWGAFAASEAFILPSHQENFGIAIVEALSCGKPALLTRPINIADDLAEDGCALIGDDTAEGVHHLLTRWLALTKEQRACMDRQALASVAARYDMRRNTRALCDLFLPSTQTADALPQVEARTER